jgi:protein-S-isoprenylcysteine O-methyltransferase Ste14
MADPRLQRAHGRAWLYLCLHIAAHVAEEASLGFLDVWNPVLATVAQRTGLPLPHLVFREWLAILVVAVAGLLALTPLVSRGVAWLRPASYVLAGLTIANAVNHLVSPLYLGRFLPGAFTSPLLIAMSAWLIVQTRRAAGHTVRVTAVAGTFTFFLVAPGTVVGWIPYELTGWQANPAFAGDVLFRVAGVVMVTAGVAVLVDCFIRFALLGRGTPAPVAPTETLVVAGLYRYTRNPMYIGVVSALVGQALFFGSVAVLWYTAFVWLAAHTFVVLYEEPVLRSQFPAYERYRLSVPRWFPRLRPYASPVGGATVDHEG